MAMMTPPISQKRMKVSKQEVVHDHGHHPSHSQKRGETYGHDHSFPFPEQEENLSADGRGSPLSPPPPFPTQRI